MLTNYSLAVRLSPSLRPGRLTMLMESRQLYRYQPFREIWLACNYLLPQGQGIREKIALLLIKLLKKYKRKQ